ncbi:hypothetical protein Tco_1544843, partial [Tanacetum coccineum]
GGAKGVHALQWLCKEGPKTHLQDGRSDILPSGLGNQDGDNNGRHCSI